MIQTQTINGILLSRMIRAGAANLRSHVQAINNLNVFPIPDGDTGDNMLLTSIGGVDSAGAGDASVSEVSRRISEGMLLSARGNSGVILSQISEGIADGLDGVDEADSEILIKALQMGTKHAYQAVLTPTEGTMLTVMRCATEYATEMNAASPEALLNDFLDGAKRTLERTPEMLPVLKKAGVVDSGGAGLVYIAEGMQKVFTNEEENAEIAPVSAANQDIDLNLFTEDSVLEYGYCTELLLRLQRCKTDPDTFEVSQLTDYLKGIGDSVVAFKTGSIVKIHIHTMTPDRVLAFCQTYGEFLKIKIENMSLQHNNTKPGKSDLFVKPRSERKPYGVVAVAAGEGIKNLFTERGADVIVDGGQSMNPSAEDFLEAFARVNAETIFVLPNNGNIVLTAKQAAGMYKDADIRVIDSHTIGDGYAALSIFSTDCGDTDQIVSELTEAMSGVITAEISKSIRDAAGVHEGEYIGFAGKEILAADSSRFQTVCRTIKQLDFSDHEICLIIRGRNADISESEELKKTLLLQYTGKEIYVINGMQDIYDYILILE